MPPQITAFGYHDQQSPRHWSVCETLRKEGYSIVECHTEVRGFVSKYRDLWRKDRQLKTQNSKFEALLVTFPGHYLVPLAWILTRFPRRKLLFDAFVSLYDTNVCDRGRAPNWHPRSWLWYIIDFTSCHLADEVLIDTEEHRQYFVHTFGLDPKKIRVVYLESRPDLFFPKARSSQLAARSSFNVLFYGTYIPLQGTDVIITAARLLASSHPEIHFTLIGNGQTYAAARARAAYPPLMNVSFQGTVPYAQLPDLICRSDVCLGIFGNTPKAQRVIPHKVYDAVACGIPVITSNSPAIRERFAGHPNVILCAAGDPSDLANTIVMLMQKSQLSLPKTYAKAL